MVKLFLRSLIVSVVMTATVCAIFYPLRYKVYSHFQFEAQRYGSHKLPPEEEQHRNDLRLLGLILFSHFVGIFGASVVVGYWQKIASQPGGAADANSGRR